MPLTLKFGRFRWSASWMMTLLTVLAVVACIDLGRWQWRRAGQSRATSAQFVAGTRSLVPLGARSTAAVPRYTQVRVQGRYDGAHQFLLDNMSNDGAPGYEVLTPLVLADGRTVMVNRGWVPLTESRQQLPDVRLTSATADDAVGRLDNLPVAGIALGHVPPPAGSRWPKLTSFPTTADLSAALGRPVEPRQLLLDSGQPQGYVRDWKPTGMSAARHLSYAIQWWGFAAVALILYGALNRRGTAR